MTHPRRFAPPLKGQRLRPGKAGSAALWTIHFARKGRCS
ncbi:MAG: hypothetical protein PWQ61_1271 [Betaproteobacteria bacterium]|jgi:hypothetical protein|nr:hypothetical protein [Betaproteobacteria bacterium]